MLEAKPRRMHSQLLPLGKDNCTTFEGACSSALCRMEVQMVKKKNKLASGNIRVQRRYKGDDGKTHTKSFTARTRAEAEALAAEWQAHRSQVVDRITIAGAIKKYIQLKEAVLSPGTVRGYYGILRNYFSGQLGSTTLLEVTNLDIQMWVSWLVSKELSPKTIQNAAGLLTSSLSVFMPDFTVRITLPAKKRPDLYCPSTGEVHALLASTNDVQLRAAILLAAIGTMRRGEICALRWSDIDGNTIRIRRAVALDKDGFWIEKAPKTYASNRDVPMPKNVLEALRQIPRGESERIFSYTPDELSNRFKTLTRRTKMKFRFHDLRHYSASQMHLSGIPDKYIEARGGWKPGSNVMKRTYQNVISLEKKKQDKRILKAFAGIL